jgi:hypothetical protein
LLRERKTSVSRGALFNKKKGSRQEINKASQCYEDNRKKNDSFISKQHINNEYVARHLTG